MQQVYSQTYHFLSSCFPRIFSSLILYIFFLLSSVSTLLHTDGISKDEFFPSALGFHHDENNESVWNCKKKEKINFKVHPRKWRTNVNIFCVNFIINFHIGFPQNFYSKSHHYPLAETEKNKEKTCHGSTKIS
jgi:hypothetical protein